MEAIPLRAWLYLAGCAVLVLGTIGALFLLAAIEDRRNKRRLDDILDGRSFEH